MLSDLENAAHLPDGRCIKGMLAGSDVWRSMEAHLRGELGKPTDMFSFGLVVCFHHECPTKPFTANNSSAFLPCVTRWSAKTTKISSNLCLKAQSP